MTLRGPTRPRVGPEMSELGLIRDGAVLMLNGVIRAVGTMDEVDPQIPDDAEVVDARGRLAMPGFVDAHTHLLFGGNRAGEFALRCQGKSYEEIAARGGGILSTVRKTREVSLENLAIEIGRKHLMWMMANGTTTIEAKSGYGLTVEDELKILRAYELLNKEGPVEIAPTLLAPHAVPPEYEGRSKEYLDEVAVPLLKKAKEEVLAEFADAFVEEGYFGQEIVEPYLQRAKKLGFELRLHVDQLKDAGGAKFAAWLGAKTADHLEQTDDNGIETLATAGVMPVLLPGSVHCLGKDKYPNARHMIEKGLPVVLATDFNPGSSPTPSMPFVLNLACMKMKMTPAEAICAATVNAAYSLNRGHDRGTLEPGKRGDIVVFDAEDYREVPYWVGRNPAWRVIIGGRHAFGWI